MTRTAKASANALRPKIARRAPPGKAASWALQDAKARFSELVRRVHDEGPQHVTVHGRNEVVVISAEEFRRLRGELTGAVLVEAMQSSPHRGASIEPRRNRLRVRDVSLS